jgi:sulfur dioxygenase
MIFHQMFDAESSTFTYILASQAGSDAIIIDPVKAQVKEYCKLFDKLNIKLSVALDTHMHADHVTGTGALQASCNCKIFMGEQSSVKIEVERLKDGETLTVGDCCLKAIYTPGHTNDSYCFQVDDKIFTGDTLLISGTGRTDFQTGDPYQQYDSIVNKLFKLPDATLVYPAHDYKGSVSSSIGKEKAHNPRLQVTCAKEYAEIMNNLNLPRPKLMDQVLPLNFYCGIK